MGFPLWPVALVLGLLVGSFLNVVIARVPVGESIVHPRSRCPKCGYMIPSWFNVPVLSWLALRGRCYSCKAPISVRYPVVELLTGVLFLACFTRFGISWATLAGWILCGSLMAIIFIDIDHFQIPDEISVPGVLLGCLLRPLAFEVPWYSGVVAAALAAGALLALRWGFATLRGIEGHGLRGREAPGHDRGLPRPGGPAPGGALRLHQRHRGRGRPAPRDAPARRGAASRGP
ncbi:MAG: prepilin peptidase [Myxococcales bacterium]|nr:prepilin peptidase [Myxococcales bacterium]